VDLDLWLALLAIVGGGAVAIYGAAILFTGRAAPADRRAFRHVKDAGLFYLCFGLALTLITLGGLWNQHYQSLLALLALVGTVLLAGLAVVRYRPRRNKQR
jgi:predicted benzoate:H+ symporter BenE